MLYWLFVAVCVFVIIDLIFFAIAGYFLFKEINPILKAARTKNDYLTERDAEWKKVFNDWLFDAYNKYPDNKDVVLYLKKKNDKGGE